MHEMGTLDRGLELEALIQCRQQELDQQEQVSVAARQDLESLQAVVSSLNQEKTNLEASIKVISEKVSREIAKIIPAATDTINRLVEELRRGHDETLAEVRRLKDEALEVGKEIGQCKEILQANEWLNELPALIKGEESVAGKRVRAIGLLIVRGIADWLRNHKAENQIFSPLLSATENLVRELEQWRV